MSDGKLARVLPREIPNYHQRHAAHLRALADSSTTQKVKARLLGEAEEHERLAQEQESIVASENEQA